MDIFSSKRRTSDLFARRLKHACLTSLLLCVALSIEAQVKTTQELPEPIDVRRFYLKANPFPILSGPIPLTSEYRLGLEVVAGKRFTYQFAASYLGKSILFNTNLVPDSTRKTFEGYEFPGYRVQLQMKYYWLKFRSSKTLAGQLEPSGLYLALHSSFAEASFQPRTGRLPRQEWSNLTVNALGGMQFFISSGLGLDVFTGLGWKQNRAYDIDYRGRVSEIDMAEVFEGGLGAYLTSNFKFSLGFNFTFGLI